MSEPITTIDLMRHGEPVGGSRYRGQIDDPLSDKGWRQMRAAVAGHCPWQVVVTSPLRRCAAFAEELAQDHGLPLLFEPRLKEIGFGAWEGRTKAEITAEDAQALTRFYADPIAHRPAGAEPLAAFQRRVAAAWNELIAAQAGRQVLVVAHAGVIRMVLSYVLGAPPERMFRIQVANAALTRIRVEGLGEAAQGKLVFHAGTL